MLGVDWAAGHRLLECVCVLQWLLRMGWKTHGLLGSVYT